MAINTAKIREEFPILQKKIGGKPLIYFDNACMSLRPKQVMATIQHYYDDLSACSGRSSHRLATQLTDEVERSRKAISGFFGAKRAEEIVFTKNTTEGINLVANSIALHKGDVVLTTDKEHNSNLLPWQFLAKRKGIVHQVVDSKEDNTFDIDRFERMMSNKVKLVAMVHTSNLDGTTIPAREICKIAHEHGALVLLDGAQSAPHKNVDVRKIDCDFYAFSGHKMCGPSGIGGLYGKKEMLEQLQPFLVGGETVTDTTYTTYELEVIPHRFEAGLQHYSGILGLGAAVEYLKKIGMANVEAQELLLNATITQGVEQIQLIGPQDPKLRGGICNYLTGSIDPHALAIMLDQSASIMVRSGAHCVHSWFNKHHLKGSLRASVSFYNTVDEAKFFVEHVNSIVKNLH